MGKFGPVGPVLLLLVSLACSSADDVDGEGGTGGTGAVGGSGGTGGAIPETTLERLERYLLGDFDTTEQHETEGQKLVERHVCVVPGRDGDPEVLWIYAEQVEILSGDGRDSYMTRLNELRMDGEEVVSRVYKFVEAHPLYSNAFAYNGPIDGCLQPDVLAATVDADLVYRAGCDIRFVPDGELFHAATTGETCTFPGGYIQTAATVFADGMDVQDLAVSGGTQTGDVFRFRRIAD